jgi:hypothetical protein
MVDVGYVGMRLILLSSQLTWKSSIRLNLRNTNAIYFNFIEYQSGRIRGKYHPVNYALNLLFRIFSQNVLTYSNLVFVVIC